MGEMLGGGPKRKVGRRRTWRWCLAAAATTLIGTGTAMLDGGAGSAGADNALAEGSSYAQAMQITPHEGSLAVGALFDVALAGVTGADAKAQSEGLDLGAVGESMRSYNCGSDAQPVVYNAVPEPLITDTGAPGAAQGISEGPNSSNYPQQVASGVDTQTPQQLQNQQVGGYYIAPGTDYFANEFVQATQAPYGEADTSDAGPLSDPTGAITISGMHSKAWAGVVNGVDETGASSDIAQVSLGGGAVVLDGLDWTSTSTESGQQSGSFTIGKAIVGGTPLPDTADLSAVAAAVDSALSNLGLQVGFPASYTASGFQFVDPMQIEVVPNATRDQVEQSVLNGVAPVYNQVADGLETGFSPSEPAQIEQALCNSDTGITVLDVTIASLDGGGYFNIALGGVNSTDGALPPNQFNLSEFSLNPSSLGPGTLGTAGTPGTPGTPGTSGTVGGPGTGGGANGASSSSGRLPAQAVRAKVRGFSAGGPLLGAGLGALALLLGLVEGDRRLMRRAQKATAGAAGAVAAGGGSGG
jgi:hypothetical protein